MDHTLLCISLVGNSDVDPFYSLVSYHRSRKPTLKKLITKLISNFLRKTIKSVFCHFHCNAYLRGIFKTLFCLIGAHSLILSLLGSEKFKKRLIFYVM